MSYVQQPNELDWQDLRERVERLEQNSNQENVQFQYYDPYEAIECGYNTYFDKKFNYQLVNMNIGGCSYYNVLIPEETFKIMVEKIAKIETVLGTVETPTQMSCMVDEISRIKDQTWLSVLNLLI
jgi:hypothetical protein